jgi:hypothetical protein
LNIVHQLRLFALTCTYLGTINEPDDDSFPVETPCSETGIDVSRHFRNSVQNGLIPNQLWRVKATATKRENDVAL